MKNKQTNNPLPFEYLPAMEEVKEKEQLLLCGRPKAKSCTPSVLPGTCH